MKKFLASLLALFGVAASAHSQSVVQNIDPKSILFSTPTLSDDIAPLEPVTHQPSGTDLIFHEDEWSQVEFFPKSQLGEIQRLLKEYKPFEQANRLKSGWRNVYVRKIQRVPVISGAQPVQQLETLLAVKVGPAPFLATSSTTLAGRVKDGFSLPLGGNITLYGYTTHEGIPVLGAEVGKNPDDFKLSKAFMTLNSGKGLLLVDWRQQLILVNVARSGQIEVWRP